MLSFAQQLTALQKDGYSLAEAQAKVAHDAILLAIGRSGFKSHSTIKGGVVMCELTKDVRRTTMDLDLDFVHYSISESSIRRIVSRWAREANLQIDIVGVIRELRQDDYRGKRVYLDVSDGSTMSPLRTKVDIGVHTHAEIRQDERSFAILSGEVDTTLYANTPEQIFAEKLLSLLRHGILSTRTKDVFDMFYLSNHVKRRQLKTLLMSLIINNPKSPVNDPNDVVAAIGRVFQSRRFMRDMASPKSNWLKKQPSEVASGLMGFIATMLGVWHDSDAEV